MLVFTPESGKVKNGGCFREGVVSQIEGLPELWDGNIQRPAVPMSNKLEGTPNAKITYISPLLSSGRIHLISSSEGTGLKTEVN